MYSAVQDKTANQARLLRIKDKTNPHNKLTNVTLSEPYQTTAVLAAEYPLEKVSREAVQILSQNTKRYHLDENGAVVLDEIAIQPQGQDDMEQLEQGAHGTVQENEPGPEQLQTLSKCNKLSEGMRETKADIQEQMDKLETYKEEQRRVNSQQQRNTTKRDRERLAQLYILGQQLSMMVQKLEGKLAEARILPEPDENSERMWRGEQRVVEKVGRNISQSLHKPDV